MEFFETNEIPPTDEDAQLIARRLQYRYVPKGQAIRSALDKSHRMYYILCGKSVCSFPQESEFEARAKSMGIDLAPVSNLTY